MDVALWIATVVAYGLICIGVVSDIVHGSKR